VFSCYDLIISVRGSILVYCNKTVGLLRVTGAIKCECLKNGMRQLYYRQNGWIIGNDMCTRPTVLAYSATTDDLEEPLKVISAILNLW